VLGFSSAAEVYERARPDYPQAAIDWLAERLPLEPGCTVIDLAAGTGKLTRQLLPTGATVIAVEPLAEMRAELERAVPSVQALEGVAEAIPLANASADAATVAQGFHWFEVERAARELHRVLRPGGALALIWNARDDADPLHRAIDEILDPLRRSAPAAKERHWKAPLERTGFFAGPDERVFRHVQRVDADGLANRFASVSFIAALPEARRRQVLAEIRTLIEGREEPFDFPYRTRVYVYDRKQVPRTRDHPSNARGSSNEG